MDENLIQIVERWFREDKYYYREAKKNPGYTVAGFRLYRCHGVPRYYAEDIVTEALRRRENPGA